MRPVSGSVQMLPLPSLLVTLVAKRIKAASLMMTNPICQRFVSLVAIAVFVSTRWLSLSRIIVVSVSQVDDSEQVSEFLSKADRKLAALESGKISTALSRVLDILCQPKLCNFAAT